MIDRLLLPFSQASNREAAVGSFQTFKFPLDERSRQERYVREFDLPREVEASLTKEQKQLLGQLTRVSRRIDDLFAAQESISFWPDKINPTEIQQAAETNPDIVSPYTYVRRNTEGNLVAIPIHTVFQDLIREKGIVESLTDASSLARKGRSRVMALSIYLKARAEAFKRGNWEYSESLWLPIGNESKIFIVVGPYDTYSDPLKIKYAWESWVGVIDQEGSDNAQQFVDAFLKWQAEETGQNPPKVAVRVDNTVIVSGQPYEYKWVGNSLPCQMELREQHGSVVTIFKPLFKDSLRQRRIPAYRSIIDPSHRSDVTDELIEVVTLNKYFSHEVSHSFVAKGIQERLGEHSAWIKELYCDLLAFRGYCAISKSKRECEIAFATALADGSLEYSDYLQNNARPEYYIGDSIVLSFCIQKGSIKIKNGCLTWDNIEAVINDKFELLAIVEEIQKNGTEADALRLAERYFDPEIYGKLRTQIKPPAILSKKSPKKRKQG